MIPINTNIQVSSEITPIKKGSLHRWALEKIEGKVDGNFIKELKVKNDGFDMVMMSGSGSTVFALSNNQKDLMKEMKKFNSDNYITILTKTL